MFTQLPKNIEELRLLKTIRTNESRERRIYIASDNNQISLGTLTVDGHLVNPEIPAEDGTPLAFQPDNEVYTPMG